MKRKIGVPLAQGLDVSNFLKNVVVPHFSLVSPLNRRDSSLFGEKLVLEKSESPLSSFRAFAASLLLDE